MKLSDPSEYIDKLKAVLEVTKAYRSIIHLDVLLSTIVETAAETVGAEAGSILLYDDEGKLRFHTASGRAASAVKTIAVEPGRASRGGPPIPASLRSSTTSSPTLVSNVVSTGRPASKPDPFSVFP